MERQTEKRLVTKTQASDSLDQAVDPQSTCAKCNVKAKRPSRITMNNAMMTTICNFNKLQSVDSENRQAKLE